MVAVTVEVMEQGVVGLEAFAKADARVEDDVVVTVTPSMLTAGTVSPIMVRPVPGCGWWPVMAVVELSRTTSVKSA